MDFFRQKVPRSGAEMPAYYRKALTVSEAILAVYFPVMGVLFGALGQCWEYMPFLMLAAVMLALYNIRRMNMRRNLGVYALITAAWCCWYIYTFGWSSGVQHLLIPLLILVFFNICEKPVLKVAYFVAIVGLRMALYAFTLAHAPIHPMTDAVNIVLQTVNSVSIYVMTACVCILFSTNIQDTERQLRLDNQELHKEADTDHLTQLPNRRAMRDEIDAFQRSHPEDYFCVAIADIDFFKKVNDTYGHQCGDYTLKRLADLFRQSAGDRYRVCRWGGEEFCFFLPGMNIDDAGREMMDLNIAVGRMELSFEEHTFSITITIGVEECDFRSPVETLLESADQKLYMGKESGRNKVVI